MFWKAAKAERCESGDEHFGVGHIVGFGAARVAWQSCRAIAAGVAIIRTAQTNLDYTTVTAL